MIDPTTDRSRTLCTNGASSVSECVAKACASSHETATIASASRIRIHLRER